MLIMPIFYYRSFLNRKSVFIITLIIVLGLFLRLWHFRELFYYAIDEEKAAYITSAIADLKHFPSAGYPSSIGFRQGPLYFYLNVIYERRGWQLSFDSLLILAACYSLLKLINGKRKYIFSLFGVLSLM